MNKHEQVKKEKEQIKALLTLKKNWDGYNGMKFSAETVEAACKMLDDIEGQIKDYPGMSISSCPCSDGGIDLHIEANGKYLSISLLSLPSRDPKMIGAYFEKAIGSFAGYEEKIIEAPEFNLKEWVDKLDN